MGDAGYTIVLSTAGSREEAVSIARELVRTRLVACVNLIPGVQSIYWWNEEINEEQEILMIMKTRQDRIEEVEKTIRSLHSYQTPELIVLSIDNGSREYLEWIDKSIEIKPD